ncbi:hotdog family protein [Flavihumibacter profundi]|uniref:3-hydroxyacyl-ACP dehydratase n=1 Tax=Flavihumibacter profundi TaxID=2716883 RepID=UPI001CC62EA1|nr:3-hydroxyacyl-ACP dehydratase [Flavihumibacter profundi]MBZ5858852.1 3-hydroxyacyl-ACP dehydratase [Flavihumibacter profundi]
MLIADFCTVSGFDHKDGTIKAVLNWNAGHAIFQGHFPGQPVVPGVCMMQLVKEILEIGLQKKMALQQGSQMKFLQFIDPRIQPSVEISLDYTENEYGQLLVNASLQMAGTVFFRFSGRYAFL